MIPKYPDFSISDGGLTDYQERRTLRIVILQTDTGRAENPLFTLVREISIGFDLEEMRPVFAKELEMALMEAIDKENAKRKTDDSNTSA
jgi:hypothetical protein